MRRCRMRGKTQPKRDTSRVKSSERRECATHVACPARPSSARALWTLASVSLFAAAVLHSGLRFQLTASLPEGVYRIVGDAVERGAVVMTCLPAPVARLALDREYVWRGTCPGGEVPVGKIVLAVPGDTVAVGPEGLTLNGHPVPRTRPLQRDSRGRMLDPYPFGSHVVQAGQLWLYSSHHAHSFDSRYFGPVPASGVVSRLVPVWTAR